MTDQIYTTQGDHVRSTTPSPYPPVPDSSTTQYPTFIRYPVDVQTPTSSGKDSLITIPIGYSGVKVSWELDPANIAKLEWMCLTRSGYGIPKLPNEGTQLFMLRKNETTKSIINDDNLTPGHWYYYSLFIRVSNVWFTIKTSRVLVPENNRHADYLWDMIPPFYRNQDDETWSGTPNSPLRRMVSLMGYELDLIKTTADGVEQMFSADKAPAHLINEFGKQNLGIRMSADLGEIRTRRVVSKAGSLYAQRGTLSGLENFIETATQYTSQVITGRNLLLTPDCSEAVDSIGLWCRPSAAIAQALSDTSIIDTYGLDISKVSAPEIYSPVVNGKLLGNAAIKISPSWELKKGGISRTLNSDMAVACGAGQVLKQRTASEFGYEELDPRTYGIPIDGNTLYYLSFFTSREGLSPSFDAKGITLGTTSIPNDSADIRYGFIWFDRAGGVLKGMDNKSFSDGFGGGLTSFGSMVNLSPTVLNSFGGFRGVTPLSSKPSSLTIAKPEILNPPKVWSQYVTSFESPTDALFAVPVIQWIGSNFGARYIAAIMVSKEKGVGIESSYEVDNFLTLGEPEGIGPLTLGEGGFRLGA